MTKKVKNAEKTAPKTTKETRPYIANHYILRSPQPRWDILASKARDTSELRGLLADGWEPFSVVQPTGGNLTFYLKRQRLDTSP